MSVCNCFGLWKSTKNAHIRTESAEYVSAECPRSMEFDKLPSQAEGPIAKRHITRVSDCGGDFDQRLQQPREESASLRPGLSPQISGKALSPSDDREGAKDRTSANDRRSWGSRGRSISRPELPATPPLDPIRSVRYRTAASARTSRTGLSVPGLPTAPTSQLPAQPPPTYSRLPTGGQGATAARPPLHPTRSAHVVTTAAVASPTDHWQQKVHSWLQHGLEEGPGAATGGSIAAAKSGHRRYGSSSGYGADTGQRGFSGRFSSPGMVAVTGGYVGQGAPCTMSPPAAVRRTATGGASAASPDAAAGFGSGTRHSSRKEMHFTDMSHLLVNAVQQQSVQSGQHQRGQQPHATLGDDRLHAHLAGGRFLTAALQLSSRRSARQLAQQQQQQLAQQQ